MKIERDMEIEKMKAHGMVHVSDDRKGRPIYMPMAVEPSKPIDPRLYATREQAEQIVRMITVLGEKNFNIILEKTCPGTDLRLLTKGQANRLLINLRQLKIQTKPVADQMEKERLAKEERKNARNKDRE